MDSGAEDEMDYSTIPSPLPLVGHPQALDDSMGPIDELDEAEEMEVVGHAGGDSGFRSTVQPESDSHDPSQMGGAEDSQPGGAAEATANLADPLSNFVQDAPDSLEEAEYHDPSQMGAAGDSQAGEATSNGVGYGGPDEVEDLARRLDEQRRFQLYNVQGQEGIFFRNRGLCIKNNRYQEKTEYERVDPPLGTGSFGTVHHIVDRRSTVNAVQKRIPLENFSPNEAINWCLLNHPGIVRFLGLMREDSTVMYYSEYNAGFQTLGNRYIRVEPQRALFLMEQLFDVLVYLKLNNIVHRDIHGGNILINRLSNRISLMMIDFGESQRITEIVPYGDRDDRWDVWCAICILIRFLGGSPASLDYDNRGVQEVQLPPDTDWRLRAFLQWAINNRPRAAEVWIEIGILMWAGLPGLPGLPGPPAPPAPPGPPATGPPTKDYVPPEI